MILVSIGFKTLVPTHSKKSTEEKEKTKQEDTKIIPELAINSIKEESESESSEYEVQTEEKAVPKDLGRKLIIYDDDDKDAPDQTGMFVIEK